MRNFDEVVDLASDSLFRAVLDVGAVLRLGTVLGVNGDGSLSVDVGDEDGSAVDVWPLDGKVFVVNAVVYVLFFGDRGVGLVLGMAKGPYPVLDLSQIPDVLTGKDADTLDGNDASAFALVGHAHDDRYYTESEVDGMLADYNPAGGVNVWADVNTFESDVTVEGDLTVDLDATVTGDANIGGDVLATGIVQAAAAWIPGVAVSLDAKLYCGFNGDEPYETDYSGSSYGHRGQVPTLTGGVIYRPGKFGKAVQLAESTTNLIQNPSFAVDTLNWNVYDNDVKNRVTGGHMGAYCCQLYDTAGSTAYLYKTATPGTWGVAVSDDVTFSAYVKGAGALVGTDVILSIREDSNNSLRTNGSVTLSGEWQRVIVTRKLTTLASSLNLIILTTANTSASDYLLVDGVQFEKKAYATPYCDGSLGSGHSWSGTAHASSSSRTAATLSYTGVVPRSAYTVGMWFKAAKPAAYTDGGGSFEKGIFQIGATYAGAYSVSVGGLGSATRTNAYIRNSAGSGWADTSMQIESDWQAGEWAFVALTYDGVYHKFYVVSEADGFQATTGNFLPAFYGPGSNQDLVLAKSGMDQVDELFILSRAASADTIRAIYESQCQLICS